MTTNDIGTSIWIDAAIPATNNKAGFEALTWVRVNGLVSVGAIGVTHDGVDIPDLGAGVVTQVKGMGSGQDTTIVFRVVDSDTGQADLKAAAESAEGVLSIKVVKASGAGGEPVTGDPVEYAQGIVHSYLRQERSGTSYEGFSVVFHANLASVLDTEPV